MRNYILWIILSFPCSFLAQGLTIQSPVRFLALGDSYTIGQGVSPIARWPVQLADSLAVRGYETQVLKFIATTGWRTDNLVNAISNQNLEDENFNLVSILIGVNNQYQNRPFSQYINEFPALVDSAIRYAGGDKDHVFIVSIPDYAFTPFGQQSSNPDEISMELDQYNAFSSHIADSMQITYFDITPISRQGLAQPSLVANDGLHPSDLQYTTWVKLMLDVIDQQVTAVDRLDRIQTLDARISPNPASDMITIEIPEIQFFEPYLLSVHDVHGALVMERGLLENKSEFSIEALADGIYIVSIQTKGTFAVWKLIKK
ncbi:MAG: GDSL-type esterase/lipase family protein [Saprospiraceae bacterium]|nr:GDSL-type esterase/lipase family protein [Saprospiraceae bacterium]